MPKLNLIAAVVSFECPYKLTQHLNYWRELETIPHDPTGGMDTGQIRKVYTGKLEMITA